MTASFDYPLELDGYVTLPNRRRLHIRPLRRCEEGPIRELFAHLSPQSRYRRFLSPMPTLPDSVMRELVAIDYRRRLALVAEHDDGQTAEVVGLASFGAVDDQSAEVALVVRDEWQRQSVGTTLATRTLQAAEARGFHRFVVHIHSDNTPIRRLLQRIANVVSATAAGGISELAFVRRS